MKVVLSFAALLVFFGEAYSQSVIKEQKLNDSTVHVFGDNFEGVVFSKISKNVHYPRTSDVLLFERSIRSLLIERSKNSNIKFIHNNLKSYFRQYQGHFNDKGQFIISVSCLRKLGATDKNWLKGRVIVKDGGANYWGIDFNVDTKKFDYLRINSRG